MLKLLRRWFCSRNSLAEQLSEVNLLPEESPIQQRVPNVDRADIERIVRRDFPPDAFFTTLAVLDRFGTNIWPTERDRTLIAALKLANCDAEAINEVLWGSDWRDVLSCAEYPNYMKHFSTFDRLPDIEKQRIIDADWNQYFEWLTRD